MKPSKLFEIVTTNDAPLFELFLVISNIIYKGNLYEQGIRSS